MKKIVLLILCIALLLTNLSACTDKAITSDIEEYRKNPADKTKWSVASEDVLLENDSYSFNLSAKDGHFSLIDKKNGNKWISYSKKAPENNGLAEIEVNYFDAQSQVYTMDSYNNAAVFGSFEVYSAENKVKLSYTLKTAEKEILVPQVISAERMEKIKSNIEAKEYRQILLYYTKYSSADTDAKTEAAKNEYPYLKEHDIYIVSQGLTDRVKQDLSDDLYAAGYSFEEYLKDLEVMGIDESDIELPPQFKVSVVYALTEDGVKATIPVEDIKNEAASYVLQSISLLPYFSFDGETENEYYYVPDGSGAVISLADKPNQIYKSAYFGANLTVDSEWSSQLVQNNTLPAYGYYSSTASFMSVVTGGAAESILTARVKGSEILAGGIYSSFNLYAYDSISIRPGSKLSDVNYYSKYKISENPEVLIKPLGGSQNVNVISSALRDYLIKQGNLEEKEKVKANTYLEFTGYTTVSKSFMGVSYDEKIVLSTIKDITAVIEHLHKNGVKNLIVRLKDIGNGGMNHNAGNNFDIYSGVGTKDEVLKLAEVLEKNGGELFIENDITVSYRDEFFDGFSVSDDTIKQLDGSYGYLQDFDLAELDYKRTHNPRYLISPKSYKSFAEGFLADLTKLIGKNKVGISWGSAGKYLFSDYNADSEIDRVMSAKMTADVLKYLNDNGSVMTDVGNFYTLEYTNHILGAPLYCSLLSSESDRVSVLFEALHGCVNYAGESLTTAIYPDDTVLRSVECGASLFYSLITEKDAFRDVDNKMSILPPAAEYFLDTIIKNHKELNGFYENTIKAQLVSNKQLTENVYRTDYSNGAYSIVNYGDTDYTADAITVKANSYFLKEGE
ncbi:MAG: hypothetical protein IJP34_02085 [Clostridia bacterium]|nr:hypothetical protein [Clostridia bacterium]